jgi:hypothetical protein
LKAYEADMRYLIDTYIEADAPRQISTFNDLPLLRIIVQGGIAEAIGSLPESIRSNEKAVAETITNNVRKRIIVTLRPSAPHRSRLLQTTRGVYRLPRQSLRSAAGFRAQRQ